MQVLRWALALNTLGSTPVEVEEEVEGEVLDLHSEKPLLGLCIAMCKVQVATLKPGLGQKIAVELALVWHRRPDRSLSLLELRLNQAKALGGMDFLLLFHLIQKDEASGWA